MRAHKKLAVFTDVDGTLLSDRYSFSDTESTVGQLLSLEAAFILVSSKTKVELEYYRQELGIVDPFISENGAAIYIPKNYFTKPHRYTKQTPKYDIIELGVPYVSIREKLEVIRKQVNCRIVGFGDMSAEDVAADTGLPVTLAALAKQREYTEPIRIEGEERERFFGLAAKAGLFIVRGDRYHHVIGDHDKGRAVSALASLFEAEFGGLESFGVGNGENDLSMLKSVDHAFFIKSSMDRGAVWSEIIRDVSVVDKLRKNPEL